MKQIALLAALLLPVCAFSQPADPATQELIEKLLARIDGLEKRVAQLESERGAPSAPAATAASATPAAPVTQAPAAPMVAHSHDEPPGPQMGETPPAAQPTYPNLKIAGFGDVDFSATNLHGPNGGFSPQTLLLPHSGFALGQATLHFTSSLSQKVSFFGELTFTARSDAGTGNPAAPGYNPEVERLILRYDANDYFKVSFGRYHTPINYWNTAFHHGQWLQTTISRPEMIEFGGSFLPVHFIGTLVEGEAPAGGLNLNYNVGLGNGRGQIISRGGDAGDINNNRAWLVNAFVKPDRIYGLQVGASVYRDEVNPVGIPPAREWIESAHVVWTKETPEIIAEFANVTHQPIGLAPVANSQAWYVQFAYRLPSFQRLLKPYSRVEQIHVPRSDAIFRQFVPTFTGFTAGLRYDFSPLAAFKVEYRYYSRRDLASIFGVFSQVSFTF